MLIKSATEFTFDDTGGTNEALLSNQVPSSGLRITFENTTDATGAYSALANGILLDCISSISLEAPRYGNNSKRVELAATATGNTVRLLPLLCQLGSSTQMDAAAATGSNATTGADLSTGTTYFDIPCWYKPGDGDLRITINAASGAVGETLRCSFAFLDGATRNVFYKTYEQPAGGFQQFFPASGNIEGFALIGYDSGTLAFNNRSTDTSDVSLNGIQVTSYSRPALLSGDLDQVISGGGLGDWASLDSYALLRNFPSIPAGNNYVQVTKTGASDTYVIGVMS